MLFSLKELEVKKIRFDVTFEAGELDYLDPKLRQSGPLWSDGVAELVGSTREIRVRGHFQTKILTECDRCLESAVFLLNQNFDLFYRPPLEASELVEETGLDEGSIDLGFYEGEGLKLEDVLQEQVLLAMPMQRLCRPDCKGICPVCGQNRNWTACGCEARLADDRWAVLKDWKLGHKIHSEGK